MRYVENFRQQVDEFLAATGMSRTQLGLRALNDSAFYTDLRGGKAISLRRADRVISFMADYRARVEGDQEAEADDIGYDAA